LLSSATCFGPTNRHQAIRYKTLSEIY